MLKISLRISFRTKDLSRGAMSLIMFEDFDYLFFFASDKFWGSEKIVFPKIFEFEKNLGPKNFGLKKFWV